MTANTVRITVPIYGLGYGGGGALIVERALASVQGVVRAFVNPATEMAYVEYDPALLARDQLLQAVVRVGFRAGSPRQR